MFVTIINDCIDDNVKGRLGTRVASLFGVSPTYVGVGGHLQTDNSVDPAEHEAAGCLIDVLDAAEDKGVVLVNVANRHAKGKKWPNGTPFGYFHIDDTLVVSTIDGYSLSLIKKLNLTDTIYVLDIPTVMNHLVRKDLVTEALAEHVIHTQFRSFEFEHRVARWLLDEIALPHEEYAISEVEDLPESIWYIDNFGNTKTTILPEDIEFEVGKKIQTRFGLVPCYNRLKDVPNHEPALIIGSSGYKEQRFVEFIVQGVSAEKQYNLSVGDRVLYSTIDKPI